MLFSIILLTSNNLVLNSVDASKNCVNEDMQEVQSLHKQIQESLKKLSQLGGAISYSQTRIGEIDGKISALQSQQVKNTKQGFIDHKLTQQIISLQSQKASEHENLFIYTLELKQEESYLNILKQGLSQSITKLENNAKENIGKICDENSSSSGNCSTKERTTVESISLKTEAVRYVITDTDGNSANADGEDFQFRVNLKKTIVKICEEKFEYYTITGNGWGPSNLEKNGFIIITTTENDEKINLKIPITKTGENDFHVGTTEKPGFWNTKTTNSVEDSTSSNSNGVPNGAKTNFSYSTNMDLTDPLLHDILFRNQVWMDRGTTLSDTTLQHDGCLKYTDPITYYNEWVKIYKNTKIAKEEAIKNGFDLDPTPIEIVEELFSEHPFFNEQIDNTSH